MRIGPQCASLLVGGCGLREITQRIYARKARDPENGRDDPRKGAQRFFFDVNRVRIKKNEIVENEGRSQ